MATPQKMKPSTNAMPFAGVVLATPIVQKLDRGMTAIAVNYNLKGKLEWSMRNRASTAGIATWTFELYHIEDNKKPLLSMTNRSIGGLNRFLSEAAKIVAKQYGQAVEKQRKTA